jgi:hypothetical protein
MPLLDRVWQFSNMAINWEISVTPHIKHLCISFCMNINIDSANSKNVPLLDLDTDQIIETATL